MEPIVRLYGGKELSFFDLEEIKLAIKADLLNGDSVIRSAFPEEVWQQNNKIDNPNKNFDLNTPLKSLDKITMDIGLYNQYFNLRPLEQQWLRLHRRLHQLIVKTIIAEAIERLGPSESVLKVWREQYISFFFAPLSYNHRDADLLKSSYSHHHYTDQSDKCPVWMKENLNRHRIEGSFGNIYDELRELNELMGRLNSFTYIKTSAEGLLKHHNYCESLEAFAQRFLSVLPANGKLNITSTDLATVIGYYFVEKPDIKDLYVHISLAKHLLDQKEKFYYCVQKKDRLIFNQTLYQFKFDVLEEEIKKYIVQQQIDNIAQSYPEIQVFQKPFSQL